MALMTSEKRKGRTRKPHEIPSSVAARALERTQEVRRSLEYLIAEARIPVVDIAAALGVSRREVWEWRRGGFQPREPYIAFALVEWAAHIRSGRAYAQLLEEMLASRSQAKVTMNAREEGTDASPETGDTRV